MSVWVFQPFSYLCSIRCCIRSHVHASGSGLGWDVLFATTLSSTGGIDLVSAGVVALVVRIQQLFVAVVGVLFVWFVSKDFVDSFSIDLKAHQKNQ